MRVITIILFILCSINVFSQDTKFNAIIIDYGYHIPGGEIAKTFGNNSSVGLNYLKTKSNNLFYGVKANYIFGENIKDTSLFSNISSDQGFVIDGSGSFANILLLERGFSSHVYLGYSIHSKRNTNQGLYLSAGLGYLQHKIFIDTKNQYIPQLDSEYKKGYDQLSSGISTQINIDYIFMGQNSNLQFYTGLEYTLGFTKNIRPYNFNTLNYSNDSFRFDKLFGFKIGLIIPINRQNSEEFHYF
tara:strand:- start:4585 stop:5316 length:732 start_codon:yes stop_codon:yes gene_type:complete